ncbi:MAG: restriction endonuclease subunit S [Erysipelotrichaceae bacterium]|jgi:type I restriction enzyme S subunit|nr:restriction endonuclease subunit S [Erysipelotrichaceae bacterium]MCI1326347.1 restriction endonuclease subunit S [Solobacterium sp.]MCH4044465.1 restriction endonuclease subunit S [Erysipelotrichaceae bacterium]MCH4121677.1 restriction endonuclease subunit S [Erysipelotrichaceae bacterium]MCI1362946.1 restriction endonuclease subunit S [Solobacterium sp.]
MYVIRRSLIFDSIVSCQIVFPNIFVAFQQMNWLKSNTLSWEQRKVGELLSERIEQFPKSDEYPLMAFVANEGVAPKGDRYDRSALVNDTEGKLYKRTEFGDFIYSSNNLETGSIGLNKYGNATISPVYSIFRPTEIADSDFIGRRFVRKDFINEMVKWRQGVIYGQWKIHEEDFLKIEVMVPSLEEQRRIGSFLDNLNHLITLHQSKAESWKNKKNRFLTISWEQRKLLDCIQKITDFRGRTPKKLGMDWSEEGYLALSALNVKDGYIDFNQDVHYGNQELYDKWMTGNELHKGQVLFTTEAPMGNVAQVPDNRRYILSQRVIALDVKDNLLTENFLATVLRTPTVFAYLTALSSGGTAKGVSQKSLSSVEIRLPKNLKEQEKIADTFSNLDHLITLHQDKLERI